MESSSLIIYCSDKLSPQSIDKFNIQVGEQGATGNFTVIRAIFCLFMY